MHHQSLSFLLSQRLRCLGVQDELYLHHLTDACHDAVRRLLGPRRALLWNRHATAYTRPGYCTHSKYTQMFVPLRETAVAAQLLYYGLTTGAGVQTLGEEYCDILQVTGKQQMQKLHGMCLHVYDYP